MRRPVPRTPPIDHARKSRVIDPHAPPPTPELRAKAIDDETLARMDHVDWLESFAKITLLPSRVPMTPRRLGVGTRLEWAARYIKLLQKGIEEMTHECAALATRVDTADKLLADAVAMIRRLKDERDRLTLGVTSDKKDPSNG